MAPEHVRLPVQRAALGRDGQALPGSFATSSFDPAAASLTTTSSSSTGKQPVCGHRIVQLPIPLKGSEDMETTKSHWNRPNITNPLST
jgi:hypothetical protein